jgi:hypothetical protein
MQAGVQFGRISRLLSAGAKRKALQAAPQFLWRARTLRDPRYLYQAAVDALKPGFPSASGRELDVLAYYLLGRLAVALPDARPSGPRPNKPLGGTTVPGGSPDSLGDQGSMTQFMLQMAMTQCSRLESASSQVCQDVANVADIVVRNLR